MADTRKFAEELDQEIRTKVAPENPATQSRIERRRPRKSYKGRALIGVGLLAVGGMLADKIGLVDLPDLSDLNPSPGQAVGKTVMSDIDIDKFNASSSDALGEATIKVKELKQVWIDKPEKGDKEVTPHETMYLENGVYTGQWVVAGKWQPKKQENGDLIITLPNVQGKDVVTKIDPKIDEDRSGRAFLQSVGGIFGDDSDDRTPRKNARQMLGDWVQDPSQSGNYHKAVACVALAGAADKGKAFTLTTKVNIQTYESKPTQAYTPDPHVPTIRFQIPNPQNKREMLDINSCLPTLYGMGYDSDTQGTKDGQPYGMATEHIDSLTLPPKIQG